MTIKTTLSFTDRHHRFLSEKVGEGVFATQSAAVASAIEQMMQGRSGAGNSAFRPRRGNSRTHADSPIRVR